MATIEVNDPHTGEWTVFIETTKTYDGVLITVVNETQICDDIMYKKLNNKYYKRVLVDNTVNVKWFGALGDGIADDTIAIQKAIDSNHSVRFDPGVFIISSAIKIEMPFSGLSIIGSGANFWVDGHFTTLKAKGTNTIFEGKNGLNNFKISDLYFEGNNKGKIAMDFAFGGGLQLDRIIVKNFTDYGLKSEQGLLRIENSYFGDNGIGAQIYSDSSISNSEFNGGNIPLKLVAGGNRLSNVWCNSGKETCLELSPLSTATGHQNTSITNLYIGEVIDSRPEAKEKYAIRILGNDDKRVQQVQISNSFFVNAANIGTINGLVKIDKADEIILNGINVLGRGLHATSTAYTSYFVKGTDSNRVTITSCIINGINKNAIYQGANSFDWEIFDNTFNNCGDTIATGDEGAHIYVEQNVGRTSIIGNKFVVASSSAIPYAAYVSSVDSLNWDSNFIAYPNPIIVKDPTYTSPLENNFAGSFYRNGNAFKTINRAGLASCTFENSFTRPTKGLQNAQFFYDSSLKKPIWYDKVSTVWRDSMGTAV